MSQIALFKYICRNVEDGFVFSGDTVQTIAKGIDFRFEDIRCLFYREFVLKSRCDMIQGKREKGLITDMFHLSQNFKTHAGVLNLAQSVTNLLYHFFPMSLDVLSPETSLINGETPVLVEYENGKNAFASMYEYWKELKVVKVRRLDEFLIKKIQVASSTEEWMSRGIKVTFIIIIIVNVVINVAIIFTSTFYYYLLFFCV